MRALPIALVASLLLVAGCSHSTPWVCPPEKLPAGWSFNADLPSNQRELQAASELMKESGLGEIRSLNRIFYGAKLKIEGDNKTVYRSSVDAIGGDFADSVTAKKILSGYVKKINASLQAAKTGSSTVETGELNIGDGGQFLTVRTPDGKPAYRKIYYFTAGTYFFAITSETYEPRLVAQVERDSDQIAKCTAEGAR